jgi:hypothetical protein
MRKRVNSPFLGGSAKMNRFSVVAEAEPEE